MLYIVGIAVAIGLGVQVWRRVKSGRGWQQEASFFVDLVALVATALIVGVLAMVQLTSDTDAANTSLPGISSAPTATFIAQATPTWNPTATPRPTRTVAVTATIVATVGVSDTAPISGTVPTTGTVPISGTTPISGTVPLTGTSPLTDTSTVTATLPLTTTATITGAPSVTRTAGTATPRGTRTPATTRTAAATARTTPGTATATPRTTRTPRATATAASATPVPAATPTRGAAVTYTVQEGDTFNSIGRRFGVTAEAIAAANPGVTSDNLQIGQTLTIPPGGSTVPAPTTYTVQAGDTVSEIARDFGITVAALLAANPGLTADNVRVGQVLTIPRASSAPAPTSAPTQRTYTVQAGDTLNAVANRFGVTAQAIIALNPGINPNSLIIGAVLVIP